MRIVGGSLRGKKLFSVSGLSTRPTSDRIRESIFNILSTRVVHTHVLDLYAGTGALGMEALSRGADHAFFIDRDTKAVATIWENIRAGRLENQTDVVQWDIRKNLRCLQGSNQLFDIVFMDPPYNKNLFSPTLENLAESGVIQTGTILVAEHSIREELPERFLFSQLLDRRKYGKTLVSFFDCLI